MTAPLWQGEAIERLTGGAVWPVGLARLLDELEARWAEGHRGLLVGHHNLNSLALCQSDPQVRAFYRACDYCYVDGVQVLRLMRLAGAPTRGAVRFSLMDCFSELLGWLEARGRRLFYLGGSPAAVERGRAWLEASFPALDAELHHGYLDATAGTSPSARVVARINRFAPDLLLAGMGMPRQEHWLRCHRGKIDAGALLQAGGTLDYYTGQQPRPPAWMSRNGLGGVYRLARNPRRLGRRYLVEPWVLIRPLMQLRRSLREASAADG